MEPSIIGLENELALVSDEPEFRSQLPGLSFKLIEFLRNDTVSLPCKEGNGGPPGLMLENGNRIYIDDNYFVENATAEVRRPEDVLLYQRAGELLLLEALPKAAKSMGIPPNVVHLIRSVTDYSGNYCGQHINVLLRRHNTGDLVSHLVPFLVSRFYACAGGWGPTGYVMTQKTLALKCVSSQDTRENRAIVNLKQEALAPNGYQRAHLTSSDATMSEWATYLTVGCTALVLKMLDDGVSVGPAMSLCDPVAAARCLDRDPSWSRPLALISGNQASGLDIQEHYLRAAEAYCAAHPCEPWMKLVTRRWRETLDELRTNPCGLTKKLDAFIKMKLYSKMLLRFGLDMREFCKWCGAICLLLPHLGSSQLPRRGLREYLRERMPFVTFHLLTERIDRQRLSWAYLRQATKVWRTMLATDISFHEIAPRGLYWNLNASGAVKSTLSEASAILQAMKEPPQGTRAQIRAQAIRQLRTGEGGTANWQQATSSKRQMLFPDPFMVNAEWKDIQKKTERR